MTTDRYESPLSGRYASEYMLRLFSADTKYSTWRKLWVSLAKAEKTQGLNISQGQIDELSRHIYDIDYETVKQREKEVHHDVMAHIYAYGKAAPQAAGIIHLGATSCYVTDNADLIIYRDGLKYIRTELAEVMKALSDFAMKYKDVPALGYTHFQPAQPVTVGKRACLWLQDYASDLEDIETLIDNFRFLGCRGTTGTEASFMELFNSEESRIDEMNKMISEDFGFDKYFDVCGQTYPRKTDSRIMNVFSSIAQSSYRMAEDIRLLQHSHQIEEPFEDKQIGSSAMAYKRNPMRCERICSLSRYVMADAMNAPMTASVQWLERSLDDSADRRISMPEGFLCVDSILRIAKNVIAGLRVNEKILDKELREYLPFIATENVMMEAVKNGADRQRVHEIVRECSMEAWENIRNGEDGNLVSILASNKELKLSKLDLKAVLKPELYIGRCEHQVEHYAEKLKPVIEKVLSENETHDTDREII